MSFFSVHRHSDLQPQGRDRGDRGAASACTGCRSSSSTTAATRRRSGCSRSSRRQYAGTLTLLRLPVNGGKGAAVMAGLRAARARGLHARVADRRRRPARRRRRAALPRRGARRAGRGDPRPARVTTRACRRRVLYGRYLTHVWVWIETLSLSIRDSMCGFRLYPLDAACALIDSVDLPTRMDFDIEILVRLHWRGLAFHAHSDARHLRGRRRLAFRRAVGQRAHQRGHTRASSRECCDGCRCCSRASCCASRAPDGEQDWWRIAERGSQLGMTLLALSCRLFGTPLHRAVAASDRRLFPADGTRARAPRRRATSRNLRASRAAGEPPRPGWRSAYRHMLAFAQSGFDKLARVVGPREYRRRNLRRSRRFRGARGERARRARDRRASRQPRNDARARRARRACEGDGNRLHGARAPVQQRARIGQ